MSSIAWRKANMRSYGLSFSLTTGIPAAIEAAARDNNMTESAYIRKCIVRGLEEDGYIRLKTPYSGPSGRLVLPKD